MIVAEVFSYRVKDPTGKIIVGTLESDNEATAISLLRARNYFVIQVKKGSPGIKLEIDLFKPKVTTRDLAVFCRQFATMVETGVPLMACMGILSKQTENKSLKDAVTKVGESLQGGLTLTEAMAKFPKVFPHIFVSMIEAGEIGGVLDQVMTRLANQFEKDNDIQQKVKSALTYPVVVLIIAVIAVVILLTFVLPTFANMLTSLNTELPLPTKIVMGFSDLMRHFWYIIIAVVTGLVFAFKQIGKTKPGRAAIDAAVLKLPVFGGLIKKLIISRFCRTLGTLIKSGVPILQALDVVKKTAGNQTVVTAVEKSELSIREGRSIAEPLAKSGVFPPMVTQMITIGEETGALDTLLEKIALFYDTEVDTTVSKLSSALEPLLILGMGSVVGFIVVSMLLPMFKVMSSIQ